MRTKVEVAKSFSYTAEQSSSSPELPEESRMVADDLYCCNGYSNPREFIATHRVISTGFKKNKKSRNVNLKLPYLFECLQSDSEVHQKTPITGEHQFLSGILVTTIR